MKILMISAFRLLLAVAKRLDFSASPKRKSTTHPDEFKDILSQRFKKAASLLNLKNVTTKGIDVYTLSLLCTRVQSDSSINDLFVRQTNPRQDSIFFSGLGISNGKTRKTNV